jgi:Predicted hydrolases or acyltransferases (alpha/beta hydrolase superfamily)
VLLLHGWPGSAFEFFDTIELLTDPGSHGGNPKDALDVIIPDLPDFGWSGKPCVPGWGADRIARALDILMTKELQYSGYGVQGGDWGAMIAARLGSNFPDRVAAIHLNYAMLPIPVIDELSEEDMEACRRLEEFDFWERAYHLVQKTKCDMVTFEQTDSPVGLAAWIIEKFWSWSAGYRESRKKGMKRN